MSFYTERWVARPAWLALSIPERIEYLDQLESDIHVLTEAGARLLGVVLHEVPHFSCHYVAVWAMPDGKALGRRLEAALDAAGWGRYFQRAERTKGGGMKVTRPPRSPSFSNHEMNGRH